MEESSTIAAIATASGRGGVAVIRVSGPEAVSIAERLTNDRITESPNNRMRIRRLYDNSAFIDEAVVLVFRAPHSYTGEDVVEFQCHGGTVTPRRVLEACFAAGARLARRGEFTERAFLNGKLDYDQAESVLALIDAKTTRAAETALAGLMGGKQRELKDLYAFALDLSTRLEHVLDVDEEEVPPDFLPTIHKHLAELADRVRSVLRRINEGRLLRDGALVVLAGPPNAGKSSLMNALLEENRAIVSDIPGTTRDTIEEGLDLDGWPIRLVDTAGLRESSDAIETEGVRRAEDLLAKADVILALDIPLNSSLIPHPSSLIPIHSKCDISRVANVLNVSSVTGEGLDEMKRAIVTRLESRVSDVDSSDVSLNTAPLHESLSLLASVDTSDFVLTANVVRTVSERLGSLVGAVYSSDLLDNLFSRFCVGK